MIAGELDTNEKKHDCVNGMLRAFVYAHDVKGAVVAVCTSVLYNKELIPIVVYTRFDCVTILKSGFVEGNDGARPVGPRTPSDPTGPGVPFKGPPGPGDPVGPR